ncbi:MAG: hypothetical protein IKD04_00620, partial [Clostridia bacterium]|nr:hypothetical protein [Clostridia bacterium]
VPEVAGEHVLITFSPATGTIDAADWDENPVDFIAADGIWTVEDEVPEEPVEDATIKIRHSVAFESCVETNYKVATSLLEGCTDIYAVFDYITFNGTEMVPDTLTVEPEIWGSDYVFTYDRTPVAEIGVTVDAVVYATKADGTKIKSVVDKYSVRQFAMSQLNKTTRNPKLETLLVDLLRYAAGVQEKFGVLTDDLVTKDLTEEQAARGTDISIPVTAANEGSETTLDGAIVKFNKALELESSTFLKILMTMDSTVDVNSLTLHMSYKDMYDNEHPYEIAGSDFDKEISGKLRPFYSFGVIAPADMRAECTIYVTQNGEKVSNTLVYGIETFCSNKLTPGSHELSDVFCAMFRYSDSAKAYFTN